MGRHTTASAFKKLRPEVAMWLNQDDRAETSTTTLQHLDDTDYTVQTLPLPSNATTTYSFRTA